MSIEARWHTWACLRILDEKGNYVEGGCGGDWGPRIPSKCPRCGGKLRVMERDVRVISLAGGENE